MCNEYKLVIGSHKRIPDFVLVREGILKTDNETHSLLRSLHKNIMLCIFIDDEIFLFQLLCIK
jgi:hypothetical protein